MNRKNNYERSNLKKNAASRRRAQRNRHVLSALLVTIAIICSVLTIYLNNVDAKSSGNSTPKYKYYKSYMVKPGDTLTDIANEYTKNTNVSIDEYIDEVYTNNNLSSDNINSGSYLYIAYYSDTEIK